MKERKKKNKRKNLRKKEKRKKEKESGVGWYEILWTNMGPS